MVQSPQLPGCHRNLHGEEMNFLFLLTLLFFYTYFTSVGSTCWITALSPPSLFYTACKEEAPSKNDRVFH